MNLIDDIELEEEDIEDNDSDEESSVDVESRILSEHQEDIINDDFSELDVDDTDDSYDDDNDSESASAIDRVSETAPVNDDRNLHFVNISPDMITRETKWTWVEVYKGHPCPKIFAQMLPMIHPEQREDNDPLFTPIYNMSCLPAYDENFVKLYHYIANWAKRKTQRHHDEVKELTKTLKEPDERISRIILGLQEITQRFRDNIYDMIDPPLLKSRRERRLQIKKMIKFKQSGYKELIKLMNKHVDALIHYGHFPESLFKNYRKISDIAIKSTTQEEAMDNGMELLLIAESILPIEEQIQPVKRVVEGIASPSSGDD